jgi:hypothetical protein
MDFTQNRKTGGNLLKSLNTNAQTQQQFIFQLTQLIRSEEAYDSGVELLMYEIKDNNDIEGKFRDNWNNRIFNFLINRDRLGYKPAINLDSFHGIDLARLARSFDTFAIGYLNGFRIDSKKTGVKRTEKSKCTHISYSCGTACIPLLNNCWIDGTGRKVKTTGDAAKNIVQERIERIRKLADLLKSQPENRAWAKNRTPKKLEAKAQYLEELNSKTVIEFKKHRKKITALTSVGVHEVIPYLAKPGKSNYRIPETIETISRLTGMTNEEALASAKAVWSFTEAEYEDVRKSEYAGIVTPQIAAINRYLDRMPKFPGEIFRGKKFKTQELLDDFIEKMKDGHTYDLPAMSSFSSSEKSPKYFATNVSFQPSVIFKVAQNKSGVTVKNISNSRDENEVLVKKGTQYKLNGSIQYMEHEGKRITVIPLEEY